LRVGWWMKWLTDNKDNDFAGLLIIRREGGEQVVLQLPISEFLKYK
jgi:hypothetical protein